MKEKLISWLVAVLAFTFYVVYIQREKIWGLLITRTSYTGDNRNDSILNSNLRNQSFRNTKMSMNTLTSGIDGDENPSEMKSVEYSRRYNESRQQSTKIIGKNKSLACNDENFLVPIETLNHCYVEKPENYTLLFNRSKRLWNIPYANVGKMNQSSKWYKLQVEGQRWFSIEGEILHFEENGGTSIRHWGDNFLYFRLVVEYTNIFSRCLNRTKPVILDTGAGTASLSAAARDLRGGNGSVNVLSYVPIDEFFRLGSMISERALPVFLHYFNGSKIPVPNSSFDVVHCRWCWHHKIGYDVWLKEVDRILIPGGAFVFTFVPMKDIYLLPHKPWFEALAKMPWDCKRYNKIMQVCIKREENISNMRCEIDYRRIPYRFEYQITQAFGIIQSNSKEIDNNDRVLNMNCPSASTCIAMENLLEKQSIMHTCRNSGTGNRYLRKLIRSGYLGILHDWKYPGPFYPRSFDVMHIFCNRKDKIREGLIYEAHRLLRPNGFLISINSTCPSLDELANISRNLRFKVLEEDRGILVAQRDDT